MTSFNGAKSGPSGASEYDRQNVADARPPRRPRKAAEPMATAGLSPRDSRRALAEETMKIITTGDLPLPSSWKPLSIRVDALDSVRSTEFFADDSEGLSKWKELIDRALAEHDAPLVGNVVSSYNETTLAVARKLRAAHPRTETRIGVLSFASATKPGGGFLNGAEAQEESLARSSTLYNSLTSVSARPFYWAHSSKQTNDFYTHSMIYSPNVVVFRDDSGTLIEPYYVDVVTSPAVNAGAVRQRFNSEETERRIDSTMRERMARILFLFHFKGCRHLVLGSFGTGVFQNDIKMVAATWAELLALPHSKFYGAFESVKFAVLGKETHDVFWGAFQARVDYASHRNAWPWMS